jgi:AsmA protein
VNLVMTDRPPPSLGTYRPRHDVEPASEIHDRSRLPRIVTQRPVRARPERIEPPEMEPTRRYRGLRLLVYAGFGLAAFVGAAVAAAVLLVPTDLVRDQIIAGIKAQTGREVVIAGRVSLSLFPRPGIVAHDVALSNPPGMAGEPMVRAREIQVSFGLLPLLLRQVSVDRLLLRQPVIDLHVDSQGKRNWDFAALQPPARLAQAGGARAKDMPSELKDFLRGSSGGGAGPQSRGFGLNDLSLGNVALTDGTVHYRDDRAQIDETVTSLDAQFSLPNIARPLETVVDGMWRGEAVHLASQVFPVRALFERRPVQVDLKLSAKRASVAYKGTVGSADGPEFDGHVDLTASSMDALAHWYGRELPALISGAVSIGGDFKRTAGGMSLSGARFNVGSLNGTGDLSLDTRAVRPTLKGALQFASLDLGLASLVSDGLPATMPSPQGLQSSGAPASSSGPPASIEDILTRSPQKAPQVRGYLARDGWSDQPIDTKLFGVADAELRIGFERAVWRELVLGGGQLGLALRDRVAQITLDGLQLYDGKARGVISIDAKGPDLAIGCNVSADGVQSLPFLKGLSGFDWISGRGHISAALAARGASERQLIETLAGKADIAVADGAIEGLDMATIARGLSQGKRAVFERTAGARTPFSAFSATTKMINGIARNDDFSLTGPDGRTTGAGTIDLPQRTLDYTLTIRPAALPTLAVPLVLTGSIDKPVVTPQLAGIANSAAQAIGAYANTPQGKEVQETVKGLLQGDPAAQAKAKSFLDQLLKK